MPNAALRHHRRDRLLTQAQLAELVGVWQGCVSLIELGRRRGAWRTRKRIARALGVG